MAQIIITFDTNGQLGLQISPDITPNIVICLGMVETAKLAMTDMHRQNQNRVQPVGAGVQLPPMPVKP
jgi:hypothetical protein